MTLVSGIHHVTAIAADPQENLDFYTGVLGMRLVKRSVNQDDPGTYHLFYADADGHPGTDLTFFPWAHLPPGRKGIGLTVEVALAVPPDTLGFWSDRLAGFDVAIEEPEERFGERALRLTDPHGLELALVETADEREFTVWEESPVEPAAQIRGLDSVRLWERDLALSADFLTGVLGFERRESEDGWQRYELGDGGSGRRLEIRELPGERRGTWGRGSVHHVAWRVADEEAQLTARRAVAEAGRRPTKVIDRFWFKSVYFLEPGGVLFELATDGPGFTADEAAEELGGRLILPPWLEPKRDEIEAALPAL
ncbi:MAG: ring-cleaving dioxygenase [Gemmatimonadetes bacterium]|uniref:Ring-cleaving dioxygenase n=1 Tax=Candidatus Kutchimonas denitrificans TaxID=3056748 RepID=A0AAE4Z4G2_9BACT|nr:ring-cleaving dioxygenase [Gemmatimonadota bacterium]NIR73584.1 ring-cleaving dioxygenase [Candidatus Kutchimonas denitrificans]NIR99543.1 ring-cleaving dioxygenase [Gemmatimonadota bacterium]NIT65163.1 ring-cleaving dioxygenase [Gemmatimonadota bacterium]NIV23696.1 ring-cleaving dioxygenase [Gemmatimonadota bacterium]